MALPIVHFNDSILRKKGAKVAAHDAALRRLANDMVETMHEAAGIGLAAQHSNFASSTCGRPNPNSIGNSTAPILHWKSSCPW